MNPTGRKIKSYDIEKHNGEVRHYDTVNVATTRTKCIEFQGKIAELHHNQYRLKFIYSDGTLSEIIIVIGDETTKISLQWEGENIAQTLCDDNYFGKTIINWQYTDLTNKSGYAYAILLHLVSSDLACILGNMKIGLKNLPKQMQYGYNENNAPQALCYDFTYTLNHEDYPEKIIVTDSDGDRTIIKIEWE